jgi:DME family drug/metabolite transporter
MAFAASEAYAPPMLHEVSQAWTGDGELSYRSGAILVAGAGVVFSFTAILFRGIETASGWQFLTVRGASAAVAMIVLTLARSRTRPVSLRGVTITTFVASALLTSMAILYILALARTSTANVTFLIAAGPLSGALFGRAFLGERLSKVTLTAMGIAAGGIAVMAFDGLQADASTGFILAGFIPAILGLYNMLIRSAPLVDPVVPTFLATLLLAVVCGVVSLASGGLAMSLRDVTLGAIAGFVLIGFGLPLFNLGHRSVPTAQISLLAMTEVVLSPVWVWIWPGETPSGATLVGGTIVIAAVIWQVTGSTFDETRSPNNPVAT